MPQSNLLLSFEINVNKPFEALMLLNRIWVGFSLSWYSNLFPEVFGAVFCFGAAGIFGYLLTHKLHLFPTNFTDGCRLFWSSFTLFIAVSKYVCSSIARLSGDEISYSYPIRIFFNMEIYFSKLKAPIVFTFD